MIADVKSWLLGLSSAPRVHIFAAIVAAIPALITVIRLVGNRIIPTQGRPHLSKPRTVIGLAVSACAFGLYFFAVGLILAELGVFLAAYVANATVVGLAIGFGSPGRGSATSNDAF